MTYNVLMGTLNPTHSLTRVYEISINKLGKCVQCAWYKVGITTRVSGL